MRRREDTKFGEYMVAAAPVPVFGTWPNVSTERPRYLQPITWIALGGLLFGLAIGLALAWPSQTLVYPGTQVAAWMGAPDQVLQASGQPVVLQATGKPYSTQPITFLQNPRHIQLTNFTQFQHGYLDQVGGHWLQGSQNVTPR
jgi:hypothetical protein